MSSYREPLHEFNQDRAETHDPEGHPYWPEPAIQEYWRDRALMQNFDAGLIALPVPEFEDEGVKERWHEWYGADENGWKVSRLPQKESLSSMRMLVWSILLVFLLTIVLTLLMAGY